MRVLVLLASAFLLTSCYTMTVKQGDAHVLTTKPSYEVSRPMVLGGIAMKAEPVGSDTACAGQQVQQVQTEHTFVQMLLTTVTFGIYSPATIRVWCGAGDPGVAPAPGKKGKKAAKKPKRSKRAAPPAPAPADDF